MDSNIKRTDLIAKADGYCQQLAEIAQNYPKDSPEYESLLVAGKAILFALPHEAFERYSAEFDVDDLSSEMIERLERMGIKPKP